MKEKAWGWSKRFLKWLGIFWLVMMFIYIFVPQDIKDEYEQEQLAKEIKKVQVEQPVEIDIQSLSQEQKEVYLKTLSKQDEKPTEDYSGEARVIANNIIESMLKSPSTADFPWITDPAIEIGEKTYRYSSYVDSENSFGAMIRTEFAMDLRYISGEPLLASSWEIVSLIIDGEKIR